jgi:hypothetical protein
MKQYMNATIQKAHDVRSLRPCLLCDGLGHTHNMIESECDGELSWMHGRCYIEANGLASFLLLPREQHDKLCMDDIGVEVMKKLLESR